MTETIRRPQFFQVPAGTKATQCRGPNCKATIYFVELGSGKRMPIDCDVDGGAEPTARSGGQGVSHYGNCPDRDQFRKPR